MSHRCGHLLLLCLFVFVVLFLAMKWHSRPVSPPCGPNCHCNLIIALSHNLIWDFLGFFFWLTHAALMSIFVYCVCVFNAHTMLVLKFASGVLYAYPCVHVKKKQTNFDNTLSFTVISILLKELTQNWDLSTLMSYQIRTTVATYVEHKSKCFSSVLTLY